MSDPSGYHDRVNPDLLWRIPATARTVLEVGCGSGALGQAFKARQPAVTWVGIEAESSAAARAIGRLDHVLGGDVEDPALALPPLPPLDCLIYGDVLEHLRDPWACLQRQATWLADDGLLLACIPNVQHWSVLQQLLQGRWPRQDEGLFDRTHLRWFTRQSIIELVAGCGLVLHELQPRIFRPEQAAAFVQQLEPALAGLGLDRQELLDGVSPLQYVVRAGRRPAPPLQLDALSLRPQVGMVDVRISQPLRALASRPGVNARVSTGSLALLPAEPLTPRLLIWQRPALKMEPETLQRLRLLLRNGYVVVCEYDDDPAHWPAIAANGHLTFRGVHAVQVSTEPLAEVIRPHNAEVAVFGNTIESLPPPRPSLLPGEPLRLFFGALNREADWAPWIDTLNATFAAAPERWAVEVVHDRGFHDALVLPRRIFTPTCDYATYRQVMARCDIAFLPLGDTRFNRMKSDLKAIEAAAHGLAIVASPTVYGDSLQESVTGRLFSNADQLRQVLEEWRQAPEQVRAYGARGRAWVARERLTAQQVPQREAWYRSLWERRDELTRQLLQRVPQLRNPA
ncbi:MAG: methyltransferase domain-containing protein [Synechococcus sp. Tobar2m-G35]|jgi:SAM-dependent methyltransferase|nr:methyltransferase domain-containing protein [Synechococcus sp. Tobar2m-G35]